MVNLELTMKSCRSGGWSDYLAQKGLEHPDGSHVCPDVVFQALCTLVQAKHPDGDWLHPEGS